MVLSVCRSVLCNEADAEDAFQATFLVLVCKAGSLSSRAVLGDWLHGVARRTALNAKRLVARRRAKEQAMARPEAQGEGDRNDWLPLLDEALSRLPEKYRLPIVLCDLEARSRREAAEQLQWPEGTVAGRLARGRVLLAKQLRRHGLAMPAGSVAVVLSVRGAASMPIALVASTTTTARLLAEGQAAAGAVSTSVASLTERIVRDMYVAKLKVMAVLVLIVAGLGGGATFFVHRALAGEQSDCSVDSAPGRKRDGGKPVMGKELIAWGEASDARSGAPDKDPAGREKAIDGPAPKLVDIATRHPRFVGEFYGWLSTDTFLLALADKDYPRGKLARRTLTTGEETTLLALTKLYNKADGGCIPQISPDGQWVLWWDMKIHDVSIYGARLDGSGSFQVPKSNAEWDNLYLFWLSDSRHFVELALSVSPKGQKFTHALTRSVDKPNVAESVPIPESSPLQAACCIAGTDIALAAGDRLIALDWSLHGFGTPDPKFTVAEVGLGSKARPDQTSIVASPPGSTLRCGAALSPRSDRIAWLVAKTKKGGGTIVSIWVSRLDGSEWREMGWQEAPDPDMEFGDHLTKFMAAAPGGIKWLPDGKTLSFFYKGDLYTIPVK